MTDPDLEFLDAPLDKRAADLLRYWESKRNGAAIPDRADIDPRDVPRLLPNLVLADAVNGGEDFRIRVYCTALVELMQEERTGKLMSEIGEGPTTTEPHRVRQRWIVVNGQVCRERRPMIVRVTMSSSRRDYITLEGISLPLTKGGTDVAMILGGIFVI